MIMTNKQAFALAVDLGLVVSIWHPELGCEMMRGGPSHAVGGSPDLKLVPQFDDDCKYETVSATALSDDGRAFLALLADEIPPTVRTPYN